METPFDITRWQPTDPSLLTAGDSELPSPEDLAALAHKLSTDTQTIHHFPYDPVNWTNRARTLGQLGYPELTFGDRWKALQLCRSLIDKLENNVEPCSLGFGMGFWMQEEEGSLDEEISKARRRSMQLERALSIAEIVSSMLGTRRRRFLRRPYPWMTPSQLRRTDELLDHINYQFRSNWANEDSGKPFCEVQRHAIGVRSQERGQGKQGGGGGDDVLGVFARRDLPSKQDILVDKTILWGCNGAGSKGDLENLNGDRGCTNILHPNQRNDSVQHDFRWIRDRRGVSAADSILLCRLLLTIVQEGNTSHPLDHSLIARLTPRYRKRQASTLDLESDLEIPNLALQQFGVDIFTNHAFDTWVLFAIDARVSNNCAASPMAASLGPLFSLFNHSCEPNCSWTISKDHCVFTVQTERAVAKGEQLFVEYDGYANGGSLVERRHALQPWLDADCACSRCLREESEADIKRDQGTVVEEDGEGWDVGEKVILPEYCVR